VSRGYLRIVYGGADVGWRRRRARVRAAVDRDVRHHRRV